MIKKKVFLLFIVSMLATNLARGQDNWIKYKIDDKISVKLPAQPTKINRGMTAHTKDSLMCFVGLLAAADSASLAQMILKPDFASGLKAAMLQGRQGMTLGDIKAGKWNGYHCYNVDGENVVPKLRVYFYLIIIGGNIYSLGAMMPDDNRSPTEKDTFFNSLTLN